MVTRDLDWGIGFHIRQLVDNLIMEGLDVEVHLGGGNFSTALIPKRLKCCDVIHVQGSPFGSAGNDKIPMVTTVHSLLKTEWKYEKKISYKLGVFFENLTLAKSRRIIAVSDLVKDELADKYNTPIQKISVIPNAIDLAKFENPSGVDRLSDLVMSCGRKAKRKGFKTLQKACKSADVRLQTFHGELSREELVRKYKEATIFVCASLYETFGFSVAEAMACRCPVISSNIPGVSGLVFGGKTGLLFKPGDAEQLRCRILYLLWNKDLRRRLAENAYMHIKNNFNWREVTKRTIKVYEEVT